MTPFRAAGSGLTLVCVILVAALASPSWGASDEPDDLGVEAAANPSAEEEAPQPCRQGGPYDDFDFWLGDWDVMVRGTKRAENLITKEMNGCIVRERYTNEQGYAGESINYYDAGTRTWKQNWVDILGGVVQYEGKLSKEGVMEMEGSSTDANGEEQMAKVTWTLLPDGRVHHVIEQSSNRGHDWKKFFDALYVKSDRGGADAGR
jgi:hypothetical protein